MTGTLKRELMDTESRREARNASTDDVELKPNVAQGLPAQPVVENRQLLTSVMLQYNKPLEQVCANHQLLVILSFFSLVICCSLGFALVFAGFPGLVVSTVCGLTSVALTARVVEPWTDRHMHECAPQNRRTLRAGLSALALLGTIVAVVLELFTFIYGIPQTGYWATVFFSKAWACLVIIWYEWDRDDRRYPVKQMGAFPVGMTPNNASTYTRHVPKEAAPYNVV